MSASGDKQGMLKPLQCVRPSSDHPSNPLFLLHAWMAACRFEMHYAIVRCIITMVRYHTYQSIPSAACSINNPDSPSYIQ